MCTGPDWGACEHARRPVHTASKQENKTMTTKHELTKTLVLLYSVEVHVGGVLLPGLGDNSILLFIVFQWNHIVMRSYIEIL